MSLQKKIAELHPEEVGQLLRFNYFKVGLELTEGSFEERTLVHEMLTYQKNMWIAAFNDMFSKFAAGKLKGVDSLQPVFSGYFVAQIRKAFFETILAPKKKKFSHIPPRYNHRQRMPGSGRTGEGNSCKSIGELVRVAL